MIKIWVHIVMEAFLEFVVDEKKCEGYKFNKTTPTHICVHIVVCNITSNVTYGDNNKNDLVDLFKSDFCTSIHQLVSL